MGALALFQSKIVGINPSKVGSRKGGELLQVQNGNITPLLRQTAVIPRHVSPDMVVQERMEADALKLQAQHVKELAQARKVKTEAGLEIHSTHAEHQQDQMKAQQKHAKVEADHLQHSIHHVQVMGELGMRQKQGANQLGATMQLYSNMLNEVGF